MLVRNLTLSGTRSEHTVRVSTIYQFMTVFNHSDHAITVFPENLTNEREKHYRVPPRIYLTLPLFGAGMVESCQREVVYTVVSEGVSIPSTVIGLTFTKENNNINMPFPDMSAPTPTPLSVTFPQPLSVTAPERLPVIILHPQAVSIHNVFMPAANTEYSFLLPAWTQKLDMAVVGGDGTFNYRVAYEAGRVAAPTAPFLQFVGSQVYFAHQIFIPVARSIFFACSVPGRTMQIEVWRD